VIRLAQLVWRIPTWIGIVLAPIAFLAGSVIHGELVGLG